MSLNSFFGPAAAPKDGEVLRPGKRKPDPPHFWTGLLTLVSGSLGMNPVFKSISCDPLHAHDAAVA